ncbi:hypothetical protein P692DRAFT_2065830 [Suillus brevipes Sb2]|nr:hypothetical protein P692DRAFT_2065830 [Suillus brevipes Sb2]
MDTTTAHASILAHASLEVAEVRQDWRALHQAFSRPTIACLLLKDLYRVYKSSLGRTNSLVSWTTLLFSIFAFCIHRNLVGFL